MAQDKNNEKISAPAAAVTSCRDRKNKREDATFLEDLKERFDEFIKTPLEDHKICFMSTMGKMFGTSKNAEEKSSASKEASVA